MSVAINETEASKNQPADQTPVVLTAKKPGRARKRLRPQLELRALLESIPQLMKSFSKMPIGEPGKEVADIRLILDRYERWAADLVPGMTFAEFMERAEKMGTSRIMHRVMEALRSGQPPKEAVDIAFIIPAASTTEEPQATAAADLGFVDALGEENNGLTGLETSPALSPSPPMAPVGRRPRVRTPSLPPMDEHDDEDEPDELQMSYLRDMEREQLSLSSASPLAMPSRAVTSTTDTAEQHASSMSPKPRRRRVLHDDD